MLKLEETKVPSTQSPLQRINAIISFLLDEFPIKIDGQEYYFDITTTPATFDMKQNNLLQQKEPILDKDICTEFRGYKLPIISTSHDIKTIDEIFKRLNSTGTKLSRHDLRQAGATNKFSMLVRDISSTVRGGKTASDIVPLKVMPCISLSNNGLDYGINIDDVFWRKHGILTEDLLRKSRDEEIIAILVGAFILERPLAVISENVLDDLYSDNSEDGKIVNNKLDNCYENVKILFVQIFNEIEIIYEETGCNISEMLFSADRKKADIFMIFFMVLLQMYFEGKAIGEYANFANAIKNINSQILSKVEEKTNADYLSENDTVKFLRDIISSYMVDTESNSSLVNEVISRLNLSATETRFTEYKIGFTFFNCRQKGHHNEGKLNFENVSQIAKVASAMANSYRDPQNPSMIIVGVSDDENTYKVWSRHFGMNAYKFNNHRVVGIDAEAKVHYHTVDNLMRKFIERIDIEPISTELKEDIKNYDIITVQKRSLVIFTITVAKGQKYGGKMYLREGTSLKEVGHLN